MSIYGSFGGCTDDHPEDCAIWVEEDIPDCYAPTGICDCLLRDAPIVYEGSHVLPSTDDRRGGGISFGTIPAYIQREGRTPPFDFLRVDIYNEPSTYQHDGRPYHPGGDATIVLDRAQVEKIRDELNEWLERPLEDG